MSGEAQARVTLNKTEEAMLDEIVRRLVETLKPERIYLFGSRARGDTHPDSDYDLLVVVKERTGEGLEMEQREGLMRHAA